MTAVCPSKSLPGTLYVQDPLANQAVFQFFSNPQIHGIRSSAIAIGGQQDQIKEFIRGENGTLAIPTSVIDADDLSFR